jgi:hypothetical protein
MPVVSNRVSKIELSQSRVAYTAWMPMVFKSIRDPMLTDALTWAFRLLNLWIVLDHPAYIPPCPAGGGRPGTSRVHRRASASRMASARSSGAPPWDSSISIIAPTIRDPTASTSSSRVKVTCSMSGTSRFTGDGPRPAGGRSCPTLNYQPSVRRGSRVKRDFAYVHQAVSSGVRCPAITVTLEAGGAGTYT